MFLNYLKNFLRKKIVAKSLSNVKHISSNTSIKTVGIVFDETYFSEKKALVEELLKNGIQEENIKILIFKNKIKKKEIFDYPAFCYSDLSWIAKFSKPEIINFVKQDFDMLINYYDIEKMPLLMVSNLSKANFKVGFSSIDKRLNHFMITTNAENYKVFINELFKYLKILNKL